MRRDILAAIAAIAITFSFISPAFARDAAPQPGTVQLAPAEIAAQATDVVTKFIKRTSSSNPDSRHRAWEMLSVNAQTNLFFGMEDAFYFTKAKIIQTGDVTLEPNGLAVTISLQGLWDVHGFTTTQFLLTQDASLIDDATMLELTVPDGLTSAKLSIKLGDDSISTRRKPLPEKDVVLTTISNEGTTVHRIVIYRLADGKTVDESLQNITNLTVEDIYAKVRLDPGKELTLGLMDLTPGQYVIAGISGGPNDVSDSLTGVSTVLTIGPISK